MLAVNLFNLTGYGFFFRYQMQQSNTAMVRQADSGAYADEDLVEMKVKLNLPYMSEWPEYERFDGNVEVDGKYYNYVKRKLVRDTLYVLCLPNEIKGELNKLGNEYGIRANDLPGDQQTNNSPVKKGISLVEYTDQIFFSYDFADCQDKLQQKSFYFTSPINKGHNNPIGQPPELL